MKKKISKIAIALCFSSVSVVCFALTSDQAGRILQEHKAREREMIFESDSPLLTEEDKGILNSYRRVEIFDSIGDKIEEKREYLEDQNLKVVNRIDSLEKNIEILDADIADLTQEINSINTRIITTKDKIDSNIKAIELLQEKIEANTQVLLDYLVYIYKKGESLKSGEDIDNLKAILLSGESMDKLLSDVYFKSTMQVAGQKLIDKHRAFIGDLYEKQIELEADEATLKQLRKQGVIEKKVLEDKKSQKQRLLEVTQGQEVLYQKYIAEKLEAEKDIKVKELQERIRLNNSKKKLLDTYGCEFVDLGSEENTLGLSSQCLDINKIIYAESRLSGVPTGNNPFDWPVSPLLGISAYYRDAGYREELGTEHDAVDIRVAQGTDIKAPMDGYVIFIQPPVNTGYAYVALKHSDGLVTLYGHVSEVSVEKYDFVKRGEVFAKSGGEYGTLGAGVLSTGPHLHFVVYENEEYVDPLNYLDLSSLQYADLPDRYAYKFFSDFKLARGYDFKSTNNCESGVFCIQGDTEIERQKYLLNTYAVGDFRNWDLWVEESVSQGIDPTFMMCVGLAETTLGRYLKTAYNIGNVGNTDSGSTYTFSSAREGVRWMTLTFNNKYLSQYSTIDQLSRYGNKDDSKPIYASSDFNWHNNIMKCMSHVKGYYTPDTQSFRLK